MKKQLGRIESASFGVGGYQDAMIGLNVKLVGEQFSNWSGCWFWEPTEARLATPGMQDSMVKVMVEIAKVLTASKRGTIENLKGCPVEVTFENDMLKSWRILTEVIA